MKRLNVDFDSLIVQLLPPHKRQTIRIKLLRIFFNVTGLYNFFREWRKKQLLLVNVTSQVKILEGYLSTIFKKGITIKDADKLVGISLEKEGQLRMFNLSSGTRNLVPLPLMHELREDLEGADFIVQTPTDVDREALEIEIEKYKQMDKKYIIKEIV